MRKLIFAALLALGISSNSFAGVIYNWMEISPTVGGVSLSAQIEIDTSTWKNGGLISGQMQALWAPPEDGHYYCSMTGLDSFTSPAHSGNISGYTLTDGDKSCLGGEVRLTYSLYATPAGLSGTIDYRDSTGFSTDFSAGGNFNFWSVTHFRNIDSGNACIDGHRPASDCDGATGRWVLDRSTLPVPEPSTYLLLLTGLGLLLHKRGRRLKQPLL